MSTPSPLSVVMAGETVEAKLLDGSKLTVFVRTLPARQLLTGHLAKLDNEAEMLEAGCRAPAGCHPLPEGWVDALTDESHLELVAKLKALNFQRAVRQAERLAATRGDLQPLENRANSLQNTSPTRP
jgi:hypothetical protein